MNSDWECLLKEDGDRTATCRFCGLTSPDLRTRKQHEEYHLISYTCQKCPGRCWSNAHNARAHQADHQVRANYHPPRSLIRGRALHPHWEQVSQKVTVPVRRLTNPTLNVNASPLTPREMITNSTLVGTGDLNPQTTEREGLEETSPDLGDTRHLDLPFANLDDEDDMPLDHVEVCDLDLQLPNLGDMDLDALYNLEPEPGSDPTEEAGANPQDQLGELLDYLHSSETGLVVDNPDARQSHDVLLSRVRAAQRDAETVRCLNANVIAQLASVEAYLTMERGTYTI